MKRRLKDFRQPNRWDRSLPSEFSENLYEPSLQSRRQELVAADCLKQFRAVAAPICVDQLLEVRTASSFAPLGVSLPARGGIDRRVGSPAAPLDLLFSTPSPRHFSREHRKEESPACQLQVVT